MTIEARDMSRILTLTLRANCRFRLEVHADTAQKSMFATIVLSGAPENFWRVEQVGESCLIGTFPVAVALELSGTLYISRQRPIITRYKIVGEDNVAPVSMRVGFLSAEEGEDYQSYVVRITELQSRW